MAKSTNSPCPPWCNHSHHDADHTAGIVGVGEGLVSMTQSPDASPVVRFTPDKWAPTEVELTPEDAERLGRALLCLSKAARARRPVRSRVRVGC